MRCRGRGARGEGRKEMSHTCEIELGTRMRPHVGSASCTWTEKGSCVSGAGTGTDTYVRVVVRVRAARPDLRLQYVIRHLVPRPEGAHVEHFAGGASVRAWRYGVHKRPWGRRGKLGERWGEARPGARDCCLLAVRQAGCDWRINLSARAARTACARAACACIYCLYYRRGLCCACCRLNAPVTCPRTGPGTRTRPSGRCTCPGRS
jgi:hypothetical protein